MSRYRGKGTWAETAVAEYASYSGFPHADRLPRAGNKDRGDVGLCPGVICEVKNCTKWGFPAWLRETAAEKANARASVGFLVVKPVGVGRTRIGDWLSVMYRGEWEDLARLAQETSGPLSAQVPETFARSRGYTDMLADLARSDWDGCLTIQALGVADDRYWYVVTRLSRQLELLRRAGYGQEVVPV